MSEGSAVLWNSRDKIGKAPPPSVLTPSWHWPLSHSPPSVLCSSHTGLLFVSWTLPTGSYFFYEQLCTCCSLYLELSYLRSYLFLTIQTSLQRSFLLGDLPWPFYLPIPLPFYFLHITYYPQFVFTCLHIYLLRFSHRSKKSHVGIFVCPILTGSFTLRTVPGT